MLGGSKGWAEVGGSDIANVAAGVEEIGGVVDVREIH